MFNYFCNNFPRSGPVAYPVFYFVGKFSYGAVEFGDEKNRVVAKTVCSSGFLGAFDKFSFAGFLNDVKTVGAEQQGHGADKAGASLSIVPQFGKEQGVAFGCLDLFSIGIVVRPGIVSRMDPWPAAKGVYANT